MKLEDYLTVEGFKDTLSNKIWIVLRKVEKVDISDLMTASNVFGRVFGLKKMKLIMENYPDILTSVKSNTQKVTDLVKIEIRQRLLICLFHMLKISLSSWIILVLKIDYDNNNTSNSNHILIDKKIVMSGSKNKTLKNKFKEFNIPLSKCVNKYTQFCNSHIS